MSKSNPHSYLHCLAVLAVLGATACSGVSTEGQLGERAINLSGTAMAWLDATTYIYDPADGTYVLEERDDDDMTLHVFFTGAVFDPRQDLRTMRVEQRAQLQDDINQSDSFRFQVRKAGNLRSGDRLRQDSRDGRDVSNDTYVDNEALFLGAAPISSGAEYPEAVLRIGRRTRLEVDFETVELTNEGALAGQAVMEVSGEDGDPSDALEGTVTIGFTVNLIPERIAECVARQLLLSVGGQGDVNPCNQLAPNEL